MPEAQGGASDFPLLKSDAVDRPDGPSFLLYIMVWWGIDCCPWYCTHHINTHLRAGHMLAFLCPAVMASPTTAVTQQARSAYIAISRRSISSSSLRASSSQFHRSDFANQPFTGSYDAGAPTTGPLAGASPFGAPRLTPKMLKQHLDQFVVGQDRAKKVLSVAVFNHYQRIQELQRREEEEEELMAQRERRERHPVESEFPGQQPTIRLGGPPTHNFDPRASTAPLIDTSPTTLDKSNIMLLGPSGVGKTLMAKTLARVLSVPFSMSDCTPFTQAGYIGEDAEVCVHRLLAAANYDVERAERGIICLDEVDKIATAKVSHGKDVSGEGVQQALLKIIEGTTVQIQAKTERNAPRAGGQSNTYPTNSPLSGGYSTSSPAQSPAKGEVYNVRTDNILFIFSGAFIGLQKHIMDRLSKGSIGFGGPVRSSSSLLYSATGLRDQKSTINKPIPILPGSEEEALYKKHLPFFTPTPPDAATHDGHALEPTYFNPLDLLTPQDLQSYGFIPELIGRIPTTAALAPLTHGLLLRILTEPRSSLLAQYVTLFSLSNIELRFTTPALHVVATNALAMGTGARALRTEMEAILGDAMFEAPGSSVKYVLVTERVAKREEGCIYLGRGQGGKFHALIAQEEGEWEDKHKDRARDRDRVASFEDWRTKTTAAAGSGG
jgi:ATP-dependent Clp protease ATP-binding subunit ClpX